METPPLISDIWPQLDEKLREKLTARFFEWLANACNQVKSRGDAMTLMSILRYHRRDVAKYFEHAIKPEFKDLLSLFVGMVSGYGGEE